MKRRTTLNTLSAIIAWLALSSSQAASTDVIHVRLKDRLDRPKDGYCLDIVGTGSNLQLDMPLFAHNCKSGPTPDSSIIYTDSGQLVFPNAKVCVTAFGVNNTVLAGTSILLRPCDFSGAFFDAAGLQKFDYLKNGQLQLRDHDLCLAVGQHSSSTYSPTDRWRVLSLQSCTEYDLRYSVWEMANAHSG